MPLRFLFSIFIFMWSNCIMGQDKSEIIQQRIEFVVEQSGDEDVDFTTYFEVLNEFYEHPINLNKTDVEELKSLGLLNEFQIRDVLLHMELFGKLLTIYELQSLKYWDLTTIQLVMPFITVDDKLDQPHILLKQMVKDAKFESFFRFQTTVEPKAGFEKDKLSENGSSYYSGNKDHYYSRIRYSYRNNLSVGITGDKDAGEEFFKGNQSQGFDFYSLHAYYKGGKYLRSIVVGDYQIQVGQGLALWTGFASGKSSDVMNVKRTADPIRPYTSVDEFYFLRGTAVDLRYKKCSLTLFGSQKKIDGTLRDDTYFSSIGISGLHRTQTEIENKNSVTETIAGMNVRYQLRNFKIGSSLIHQSYDYYFLKEQKPYNLYDFRGNQTTVLSSDYNWVWRNVNFFGEFAYSSCSNKSAQIYGMLLSLDPRISMSLVYRNYEKAYHSFYSNAFSEGGRVQNEKGLFIGSKIKVNKVLVLNSYADFFSFPWLKYQVSAPSTGYELFSQLTYKPNKMLEVYGRFRMSVKQKDSRNDGAIADLENFTQRNYRIHISYKLSDAFTIKSRLEYVSLCGSNSPKENGVILYQDLSYQPLSKPIDLTFRYALFQTDSYDSRIYAYESNALYVYSIPSYFYQGSKVYGVVRYSFFKVFDLWIRYGTTLFSNRDSIGTGLEEIKGDRKSDITVQLRVKI